MSIPAKSPWFPPGVTVRVMPEDYINLEPVLVCASCAVPRVHDLVLYRTWRCRNCATERHW